MTFWMQQQPVNMNKLSRRAVNKAALLKDLKEWPKCKVDLKHLKDFEVCSDFF